MVKLSLVEEIKREAEDIKKELEAHTELEEIYVTPELDARLKAIFQKYLHEMEKKR